MYTTYMFEGGLYNDIIKEHRKRKQKNQIYWNWEDRKSMKRQYFLLLIICISLTGCGKKETTQIEAESAKKELKQQDQYSVYHLASTIDLSNTQETYKAQNEFSTCIMGQDGKLQLAFYMDKETGKGYGWKYGESVDLSLIHI